MASTNDEIFIIKGKTLTPITPKPLEIKQFGATTEEVIHNLLERSPSIIPGIQMTPNGVDHPLFVHLGRSFPLGIWQLDHLFVDQFGVLTFVETKLIENPAASRVVIGKLIDFASCAQDHWYAEKLQRQCYEYASEHEEDLDEKLRGAFGVDLDIELFWKLVEQNLRIGKVRLLAVSESLRSEVRRMLEYLNTELNNAQVFGLELKVFDGEDGTLILVPKLVGQTEASIARDNFEKAKAPYSTEELEADLEKKGETILGKRLKRLFDYATGNELFLPASAWSQSPSFSLRGESDERVFTFFLSGRVALFIHQIGNIDAIQRNDMLISRLKKLLLLSDDVSAASFTDHIQLTKSLDEMEDTQFSGMLITIGNYYNSPVM